jgi:glycosyltransferase involved in cell wall biosynthesis
MSVGTPIVVSDIEIFREIGGDAAKFFDQNNPEEFAKEIRGLSSNDSWQHASGAAIAQSKLFSWDVSAKKLLGLIQQICM